MTESVTDEAPIPADYMSVEDVAEALEVNKRTVLRWVEKGEIAHVRFGKVIRIPRSALEAQPKEEAS